MFQQIHAYNVLQMTVARSVTVDWYAWTLKWSVVKWDQSCFKQAYKHGPQNKLTVKKVNRAFVKRLKKVKVEGLAITSMATITIPL